MKFKAGDRLRVVRTFYDGLRSRNLTPITLGEEYVAIEVLESEYPRPGTCVIRVNEENVYWHESQFELVEAAAPAGCTCATPVLMSRGCQCGWMQKERQA